MTSPLGQRFANALAAKDFDAIVRLLAPNVDFKGLTPGRFWEANDAPTVVGGVLQQWFEDGDNIEALLDTTPGAVGDRESLKYRLKVRNADGAFEVEQQAYYETDGERITMMRVRAPASAQLPPRAAAAAPDRPTLFPPIE
jgi:hypothetical protein